jgi:hypothetical protein
MNVVLDSTLVPASRINRAPNWDYLVQKLSSKLKGDNKVKFNLVSPMPASEESNPSLGLIQVLSMAYSAHRKVAIKPQDIWFIVMCEIAKIIKHHPEECRELFTASAEKTTIMVQTDDVTQIDLEAVAMQLKEMMPVGIHNFIPTLSTMVPEARIALCAALCDGVQVFYNYMTYCCGIPEIRVDGTAEDWETLSKAAHEIDQMFYKVGLTAAHNYMAQVSVILHHIANSFNDSNGLVAFWKDIFTQENIGSGGELLINGWITKLFYEKPQLYKIENFTTSVAVVPYKNAESGREFKGVYGAFLVRDVDGVLESHFDNYVFEEGPIVPVQPTLTTIRTVITDSKPINGPIVSAQETFYGKNEVTDSQALYKAQLTRKDDK